MAAPQRLLIPCACCCLLVLAGQTARADYLGLTAVVRTDLTICQDISQDFIDEPLTVCNFFVAFDDPTDRLLSIGNSDITTTDPDGYYQLNFQPFDVSPPCDLIPLLSILVCDSFITIGVSCHDDSDATSPDADWDSTWFNTEGRTRGGWFAVEHPDGTSQGDAGAYPNNLVLFLQTATARGESVSGNIDVFWQDNNTGEVIAEVDVTLECSGPCPGDLNIDGRVGSFDLSLLLSSWGPNPGDPADFDGDGVVGAFDLAMLLGGWGPCCILGGFPDGALPDTDGDGFVDDCDNCPELFNSEQNDCDENGMGDACTIADGIEGDCNDNNLPDNCEDCNENGVADECDLADGTSEDCSDNGVPDECEPDCNDNGIADSCDIADGTSEDCTANGVPDECEPDCNDNSVADSCDIADGTSEDCTGNGLPDECEPDCNENGVADSCDIAQGTSEDCNDNGVPDSCDIADGASEDCAGNGLPDECEPDCNENGVADSCDIAQGTSEDCNDDGVPDECETTGPVITQQPVSQEVEEGELVVFSVFASGILLEYQWRKDSVDLEDNEHIFGSQSPGLLILEAAPADAGEYDCAITDFWGCQIVSDPATLTVLPP